MSDDLRELIARVERDVPEVCYGDVRALLDIARATLAHNERKVAECLETRMKFYPSSGTLMCDRIGEETCHRCPRRHMVPVNEKDGG